MALFTEGGLPRFLAWQLFVISQNLNNNSIMHSTTGYQAGTKLCENDSGVFYALSTFLKRRKEVPTRPAAERIKFPICHLRPLRRRRRKRERKYVAGSVSPSVRGTSD